jgi:phage terminase large subunit
MDAVNCGQMEIAFPKKLLFLINEPARYKVLYGGRGAGKTENIARALIILSRKKRLRIACFRELQKSIRESVFETIANAIRDLDLEDEFEIQTATITNKRTKAEFIFAGLRYNINSIKSLARIDIAWIEEAVNVSKSSWDKLGPTIRGKHETDPNGMGGPFGLGPEIWVSFNPELDTDETYSRFILKKEQYAPDYIEENGRKIRYAFVLKLNWNDNPWFPPDLRRDMQLARLSNNADWLHVWEGNTKQTLDGAIYAEEIKKVLLEGRRGKVAYLPEKPVHTFWDLGHNDHTAIWFAQQVGTEYNLINYFQDRLKKLPYYLEQLQSLKYNYGFHYLPHDADNETLASRSIKRIVLDAYPGKVRIVPRVSQKVQGIRAARVIFDLCNFDEINTSEGWQCLCRYSYDVDEDGQFSRDPAHNEWSHGADAFQTLALSLRPEQQAKKRIVSTAKSRGKIVNIRSSNGWMGA